MKPSHALSIWLEDQTLYVELPGTGELSHTIKLSPDNYGQLFSILRSRRPQSRIGERGAPTQYQVDGWLKEYCQQLAACADPKKVRRVGKPKVEMTVDQRAAIDQILREMGIG